MSDRRRASRFVVPESADGSFRLMQDVYVERCSAEAVLVVSDAALSLEEGLVLELPGELGARSVVHVRVASSTPFWNGDARRHRVTLSLAPDLPAAGTEGQAPGEASRRNAIKTSLPTIGLLIRRVPIRVRDVSSVGCLLESADALPEGGVGLLELVIDGQSHSETLRLCRSNRFPGSPWPWRSGAHFLALAAPPQISVRNVVARFEIVDELGSAPETLSRMYRSAGSAGRSSGAWRGRSPETLPSVKVLASGVKETRDVK